MYDIKNRNKESIPTSIENLDLLCGTLKIKDEKN